MTFPTEIDAAKFLLQESSAKLLSCGVNFAVVGGWSAYLFHRDRFGHPGTFDVDVLLHSDSLDDGTFVQASERLLADGYLRAPKNVYQAHRILSVAGEEMVFHVDFLNERNPGNALDLVGGTGRMKSIYTESMRVVFEYANYRTYSEFPGVRFPSPETFIATKAAAALVQKRPRDAFDIFVTVRDQEPDEFAASWRGLVSRDGLFSDANGALHKAIEERSAIHKVQAVLHELEVAGCLKGDPPGEEDIRSAFRFLV